MCEMAAIFFGLNVLKMGQAQKQFPNQCWPIIIQNQGSDIRYHICQHADVFCHKNTTAFDRVLTISVQGICAYDGHVIKCHVDGSQTGFSKNWIHRGEM